MTRDEAPNASHDCLDARSLVRHTLNFTGNRWDCKSRDRILDGGLAIPGALDLIKLDLEQPTFDSLPPSARRNADGFHQLVAE
ncbi:MAG: hypothetical protein Fur0042_15190 [Cyanophyceae cyanobacterium]